MKSLYHAIDVVYDHTVGRVLGHVLKSTSDTTSSPDVIHLGGTPELLKLPTETTTHEMETKEISETSLDTLPQTFKAMHSIIEERADTSDLSHTVAYIASAEAPLFATPTKDFDTVITTLPYGAMVMVLEEKGRFSRISQDGIVGWVQRDDMSSRAAYVYPEFLAGQENGHDDPNTLRVRACIKDMFHGGESEVSLQAGEYIAYKLMRKNLSIPWPPTRPRVPGRWHMILRGVPGIHIGVTPKTGSIMESTLEGDIGHLAYVEAVYPDERILISEANNPDRGIYSERTLTKEAWQELNPVFIQVS